MCIYTGCRNIEVQSYNRCIYNRVYIEGYNVYIYWV